MGTFRLGSTALNSLFLGNTQINNTIQLKTFISASGGTVTTSGSYKIHTFSATGSNTLQVTSVANYTENNLIEYFVLAAGGAGGNGFGGG